VDWATAALSGTSLVAGAGLAMMGQYFADARTRSRDRETRREEFRIKNFEIQRDALLELQEVVTKFTKEVSDIGLTTMISDAWPSRGLTMFYQVKDGLREVGQFFEEYEQIESLVESGELSEEKRIEFSERLQRMSKDLRALAQGSVSVAEGMKPFAELESRIEVLPARTGDRIVFERSAELQKAFKNWLNARSRQETEEFGQEVREVARKILHAIGEALRNGPLA
jgi:hypothetical protein